MHDFRKADIGSFPDDYPEGCPPDDAPYADCEVFRVVSNNPPDSGEFPTLAEKGRILNGRECECHGLSVFRDRADAQFCAEKYPHLGSLIARAELSPSQGKLAATPRVINGVENSHATWWPFTFVSRHTLFTVVSEG